MYSQNVKKNLSLIKTFKWLYSYTKYCIILIDKAHVSLKINITFKS